MIGLGSDKNAEIRMSYSKTRQTQITLTFFRIDIRSIKSVTLKDLAVRQQSEVRIYEKVAMPALEKQI